MIFKAETKSSYPKMALFCAAAGASIISTSGAVIRAFEDASDWQIIFWRGVFLFIGIALVLFIQNKGKLSTFLKKMGHLEVLAGCFLAGALCGYVIAILNTTVANAVVAMGAVPFFAALFAGVFLGERIPAGKVLLIAIAISGVLVAVADGIDSGGLFGNVMALVAMLSASLFFTILRLGRRTNMVPSLMVAAVISALFAAFMAGGDLMVSSYDLFLSFVLGTVIAAFGQFLLVLASRTLLAAEVGFFTLFEIGLAPFWVWVLYGEKPGGPTLVGGGIILAAIAAHVWRESRPTGLSEAG